MKLQEMEGFARGTTSWRDDETEESIEEEMCRVKREFKSLKSYVSTFTNVRETTIQELFERSGQSRKLTLINITNLTIVSSLCVFVNGETGW